MPEERASDLETPGDKPRAVTDSQAELPTGTPAKTYPVVPEVPQADPPIQRHQQRPNLFQWQSQFAKMEGGVEARNQQTVGMIEIVCFYN